MPTTYRDLLEQTRAAIREVDALTARDLIAGQARVIDVREQDEIDHGVIPGALHIPRGFLEARIEEAVRDKSAPVIVYCAGGARSAFAAKSLAELGYTDVMSLAGGFAAWKAAGLPWSVPRALTAEQRRRYSRHILLPEVGEAGQRKLLDAKVLLVGAGGLGSPAALYLAAAGVGTLGVIDDDVVDDSNLQRQVIHTIDSVGMPKVESARRAIETLNPDVRVIGHQERLTKVNALDVIADYDVVLDGADNFPTRYLINDACVLTGRPNVHGGVARFDGQVTIFCADGGPCYRCLFRDPPPPGLALNCAEAGVLGVLPGLIGLLQATEVIKLVLGVGEPLIGRLLTYDGFKMTFRELRIRRDPTCPMCGLDRPSSLDDIEYTDVSCAIPTLELAATA